MPKRRWPLIDRIALAIHTAVALAWPVVLLFAALSFFWSLIR